MKRFVVGVIVGLVLAGGPVLANWDMMDYSELKDIRGSLASLVGEVHSMSVDLSRIAAALERAYPPPKPPAEAPLVKGTPPNPPQPRPWQTRGSR